MSSEIWTWIARDVARKQKPVRVSAATYFEAKKAACRAFGFVVEKFGNEECDLTRVEVEAVRAAPEGTVAK